MGVNDTFLSRELKQLFEKKSNKLIFGNKFTLNQLALEIYSELGFHGFDSSLLSKAIHGKRLLNVNQIKALAKVQKLSKNKERQLINAYLKDLLRKTGLKNVDENFFLNTDEFTQLILKNNLLHIKELRNKGLLLESIDFSSDLIQVFKKIIKSSYSLPLSFINLYCNILYEKAYSIGCIASPEKIFLKNSHLINTLEKYGQIYGNINFRLKSAILRSFNQYSLSFFSNNKRYYADKGIKEIYPILRIVLNEEKNLKITLNIDILTALRCLLLNSIYSKREFLITFAIKKIWEILSNHELAKCDDFILWCISAIARGKALLRKDFEKELELINKLNKKITPSLLRDVSLIRNEFEILEIVETKNKDYKIKLLKKGLFLSNKIKSTRYRIFFEERLINL